MVKTNNNISNNNINPPPSGGFITREAKWLKPFKEDKSTTKLMSPKVFRIYENNT